MPVAHPAAAEMARDCLASRARYLDRALSRLYDTALRGQGITAAQLEMLVAIQLGGPTTSTWVGHRLQLEKSSVSRSLGRLVAAGLLACTDGLRITARGEALIRTCHPLWRRAQKQARAMLGTRERHLLAVLTGPGHND